MSKIDQNERQNTSDYHIEGILEVPDPANIFPLPPIPSRSKQGLHAGQRIAIYFAGSRAIQHGVQPLGVTAFICGVTGRRYVDERILDKRKRRYASVLADPNNPKAAAKELVGGGDIFLMPITDAMLVGVKIPVGLAISKGVIEARLKPGIVVEDADKAVANALAHRSLNRYLATSDGKRRLSETGIPVNHRFCTKYSDIGPEIRLSEAHEVFCIRPMRELQGLLNVIALGLGGLIDH